MQQMERNELSKLHCNPINESEEDPFIGIYRTIEELKQSVEESEKLLSDMSTLVNQLV